MGFATKNRLFIGGGGGSAKTGVRNEILLCKLDLATLETEDIFETVLPSDEDAVMCLGVHPKEKLIVAGINKSEVKIKERQNNSLRLFKVVGNDKVEPLQEHEAMAQDSAVDPSQAPYLRITEWSPDGVYLLTAGTNGELRIFRYPTFNVVARFVILAEGTKKVEEIYDAHFSPDGRQIIAVTPNHAVVYQAQARSAPGNDKDGEDLEWKELRRVNVETFNGRGGGKKYQLLLRQSRYNTDGKRPQIFFAFNSKSRDRSFVSRWDAHTWDVEKTAAVARKPIMNMAVSPNGKLLGLAMQDFSITLVTADNLQPYFTFPNAHSFAITCLTWTRDSNIIVSGSADSTVRAIAVPPKPKVDMSAVYIFLLAALFLIVFIVLIFRLPLEYVPEQVVAPLEEIRNNIQNLRIEL
ncbi:WD40 repeat-like protein [Gonapodya prolifera JEL478]|uniref:WD40 repeat-like protein n=1 Tax=Gonapodya prolifera (strain JEL478) TaxID=1344416 RepID=A0A139AST6_GONPJ|nr:WD40 repeat-like protein [Gonapodya prolifera JEL478]|eukprot:KXS19734.1 WD40 repeat-like protein [Gonapodya prolifera JEL478]